MHPDIVKSGGTMGSDVEILCGTMNNDIETSGGTMHTDIETPGGTMHTDIETRGHTIHPDVETPGGTISSGIQAPGGTMGHDIEAQGAKIHPNIKPQDNTIGNSIETANSSTILSDSGAPGVTMCPDIAFCSPDGARDNSGRLAVRSAVDLEEHSYPVGPTVQDLFKEVNEEDGWYDGRSSPTMPELNSQHLTNTSGLSDSPTMPALTPQRPNRADTDSSKSKCKTVKALLTEQENTVELIYDQLPLRQGKQKQHTQKPLTSKHNTRSHRPPEQITASVAGLGRHSTRLCFPTIQGKPGQRRHVPYPSLTYHMLTIPLYFLIP